MPIPSVSLPAKSPGLPMSPRPGDRPMNSPMPRAPVNGLASPGPLSPRGGGGLPLSPRAPRGPLPLPQNHALAAQSPHFARAGQYPDPATQASSMAEILQQTQSHQSDKDDPASPVEEPIGQIFRGFVSDDHPKLLLPPNALPLIYAKVHSSRLRPSRSTHGNASKNSDDDQIFTLAVHSRSDNAQLWRVEKTTAAFGMLDQTLRASGALKGKTFDRSIFSGHSPAKIDARRAALDEYFESILDTDMDSKSAEVLCHFFSSNTIGPRLATLTSPPDTNDGIQAVSGPTSRPKKEGYLAKKGKQFGGWKARYFVLDERLLHYFEAPNVGQLGTIKLTNAQIARQNAKEAEEDAEFRHAFMILEPKRRDSSSLVRHVLCAESDAERDEWVEVLMQHVGTTLPLSAIPPPSQGIAPVRTGSRRGKEPSDNSLQTVSYEETVQADTPVVGSRANGDSPSSASLTEVSTSTSVQQKPISGPVGGGPIQNVAAWGNKSIPSPTTLSKEHKKRSMFGFINRGSEDNSGLNKPARSRSRSKMSHTPLRPVFGLALAEAAEYFAPEGIDICLPAPIYRCIEYLEAKNASSEEGIFRLSGSNTVVKGLKEKFNAEGDVKLVEGPYYDIHAIASLLKLYLRELPESILTRELHLDFLRVLETEDKQSRIAAFNVLVHRLPEANLELLATLSRFLIDIVNHSDVNLMSVRNVGIVFSPTLNIPAPLISLLLSDYDSIFAEPDTMSASAASPVLEDLASAAQDSPMDLRSPRKQMFQELPTPGLKSPQFQSMMSPGFPRPKGDFRGNYDTGFVPMQPSYESRQAPQPVAQVSQDGYGSLNAALAPATSMSTSSRPFPSSSNQAAASRSQSDSTDPIAQTYEDLAGPPKVSNVITTNLPAEVATHRRGRRESALLGGSALSSSPSGTSGSLDARRKSSYQRLREMAGLRE
ncbi:hypothetical protein FH972_021125 [Carpinus fangiana]|uniref:Rho-GAP domain-containing protein n=1 Tax=Carpinus fangiana TaxID=176857 RepID=A0A5N6KNT0_9ROSI|nr:hypothetical protein FH972_021125 [Carpinus fangiana]